ncbi:MAG TPA: flagellar hook-associated protein FlgK [Janthinobacterium sp.]|jgi:flagellar hook-associated protein 1 FlgK|nr:flagellar hook-associated protein FlgK [Janthinobacterium sp.]
MSIINNALTGASAAQVALNTVSQNTANLQTPGYSRQSVVLASVSPGATVLSPGNGVTVTSLTRINDGFKDQAMWSAASSVGQFSQSQSYYTQLEQVMSSTTSSLSSGIDGFFTALNASGGDPTSTPLRQAVVTAAGAMAQTFNSINGLMNSQQVSVDQQRSAMLPEINSTVANIASLNQQITSAGSSGTNISALQDARDNAIDSLSSLVSVSVNTQADGSVDISLQSGQPLVIGATAGTMSTVVNSSGGTGLSVAFSKTTYPVDNVAVGGEMGGLGAYVQNTLQPMQQSVQDLANQLSTMVNNQLALGTTMTGAAGTPLFTFTAAGTSTILSVTSGFQASDLAFSADGTPGNSDNLQALIGINSQTVNLTSIGSVVLSDADSQLVGQLGIDSQQNQSSLDNANTVRTQATQDWQSTSGVNQDEEAANLIQYQNMYQANMKVISAANTVFQATLNMMGN